MNRKKVSGSITIEATIAFTVFFCFMIFLLTIVRIIGTQMMLDSAVKSTVRTMANRSYIVQIVNNLQDMLYVDDGLYLIDYASDDKVSFPTINESFDGNSFLQVGKGSVATRVSAMTEREIGKWDSNFFAMLFGGGLATSTYDIGMAFFDGLLDDFSNLLFGDLKNELASYISENKNTWLEDQAIEILMTNLDNTSISLDMDQLELSAIKWPQSQVEYYNTFTPEAIAVYSKAGLYSDTFKPSIADVALVVTYTYNLEIPLMPSIEFDLVSSSVERGWTVGGDFSIPSAEESLDLTFLKKLK